MKRTGVLWRAIGAPATTTTRGGDPTLGYAAPAARCMNESLPIGNGRGA
jgi:hypothetical protein